MFFSLRLFKVTALSLLLLTACKWDAIKEQEVFVEHELENIIEMMKVPFYDVPNDHIQIDAIVYFYEKGFIQGFEDNTFRPEQPLTEAQFLDFLIKFYDELGNKVSLELEESKWVNIIYNDLKIFNFPLLGYDNEENKHIPIKKELVSSVLLMLHKGSEELNNILEEELYSNNEDEDISRAQFLRLMFKLDKGDFNQLQDGKLTRLKEAYEQEIKEAKREQQEKERLKQEEQRALKENLEQERKTVAKQNENAKPIEEELKSEKKERKIQQAQIYEPGIAVTDILLPLANSRPRTSKATHVVIHFMSNGLNRPDDPYNIKDIESIFKRYGFSAHYVIDRKGKIYRFVSEERVAFHAGKGDLPGFPEYKDKMNDYSIGIELLAIGTREEMLQMIPNFPYNSIDLAHIGYTSEQFKALKKLLDDINKRHPTIPKSRNNIIGHDEYSPGRKTDPGSLFDWSKVGF